MISLEHDIEVAERPVLIARIGVPHAEPLGFYKVLSDFYGADLFSPIEYVKDLYGEDQPPTTAQQNTADRHMLEDISSTIDAGRSVVCDALVNKPIKQEKFSRMAADSGLLFVLIRPELPTKLVHQRIIDRVQKNETGYAFDSVGFLLGLDRSIRNYCRKVGVTDVDALNLDGSLRVGALLADVDEHIRTLQIQS
jgi:hypothetical protein